MASGNIHIGTMAGKLNGVMLATRPTGCLIEYESTLVGLYFATIDSWVLALATQSPLTSMPGSAA